MSYDDIKYIIKVGNYVELFNNYYYVFDIDFDNGYVLLSDDSGYYYVSFDWIANVYNLN